jgi:hypothetical protein
MNPPTTPELLDINATTHNAESVKKPIPTMS